MSEKSLSDSNQPVALVTGASSGIGAAWARALSAGGYRVILVGRNEEKLRRVASETGGELLLIDLASEAALTALEQRVLAEERLDFLVNNAGFGTMGKFWEADAAGQIAMHQVHVMATIRLTRAALPRMVGRDRGSIVNVSSVSAWLQASGAVSYSATKAWMNSFTEGIWIELKSVESNVRVQALCPGFTRSDFHQAVGMDTKNIPEALWTSAEAVVEASLQGLSRNKPIVVPGWRYQTWVAIQRYLPRPVLHAIAAQSDKMFRKPVGTAILQ